MQSTGLKSQNSRRKKNKKCIENERTRRRRRKGGERGAGGSGRRTTRRNGMAGTAGVEGNFINNASSEKTRPYREIYVL